MDKVQKYAAKFGLWHPLVIVPIYQEFLFRYLPYRFLYLEIGHFWLVGLASNVVFALIHWYFGWKFVLYAFSWGIVLWLVMNTYGVAGAILLHAFINLLDLRFGVRNYLVRK